MNFFKYKSIYIELLPIFVPVTTFIGFINGLTGLVESKQPFDRFSSTIGFTALGIITGVSFPISYPLLGLYVLLKKKN